MSVLLNNLIELFDAINEYTDLLKPGFLKITLKASSKLINKHIVKQMNTIDDAKYRVKKALGDFGIKVLVVIDDIDRLPKEQIRLIFQLVTTIADFKSVNYLISYDKKVVEEAVSDIQGLNGNEYLEKIIQVPINMPHPSTSSMNAQISKRLGFIPNNYYTKPEEIEDASSRFSHLLSLLQKIINTTRRLNRLCNSMYFKLPLLAERIDAIDLLALESINVTSESALYWIVQHIESLRIENNPNAPIRSIDDKEWACLKKDFFSFMQNDEKAEDLLEIIQFIFKWPRQLLHASNCRNYDAHIRRRIIDFSLFEYYLTNDSNVSIYATDILFLTINNMNPHDLSLALNNSIQNNGYLNTIESIASLEKTINAEKAKLVITTLTDNIAYADRSDLVFSENTRTIDVIETLLTIIDVSARDAYLLNLFNTLNSISIVFLAELIIRRERAYKRNGFKGNRYDYLISEECLEKLEQVFSNAMRSLAKTEELEKIPNLYPQLSLWRNVDKSSYCDALKKASQNPLKFVLFSESFVSAWRTVGSGAISSFHCNQEILDYTSRNELTATSTKLLSIPVFYSLKLSSQQKAASLIIALDHCVSDKDISNEIGIDEVNKWIEENLKNDNYRDQ